MSVLIKGMEMPSIGTYEASIDVTKSNGKTAISVYLRDENDSRRFSVGVYEAIHVPPHGRLIDETDVINHFVKLANDPWNQNVCTSWGNAFAEAAGDICDMPTIIPAEEGE